MNADFASNRICVVPDSCVWRSEPLLRTPLGITLVYTLSRLNSVLGLPEVVEQELTNGIVTAGLDAVDKSRGPLQTIRTITGDRFFTMGVPDEEAFRMYVAERLTELDRILVREPFTLEHAKAALAMVNAKLPPNGDKNQQFKDSAIWQAVLSLSKRFSVVLLTYDKGFFLDRDPGKGLARNLLDDCNQRGVTVKAYGGIGHYLNTLKGESPEFDREQVKESIVAESKSRLASEADRYKIVPTELLACDISGFATENPDRVAVDYTLTFKLEPVSPEWRINNEDPRGVVHGSCYFLLEENNVTNHYIQRVAIKYIGSLMARSYKDYDDSYPFPRPLPWD
jgi:hypothetical protein